MGIERVLPVSRTTPTSAPMSVRNFLFRPNIINTSSFFHGTWNLSLLASATVFPILSPSAKTGGMLSLSTIPFLPKGDKIREKMGQTHFWCDCKTGCEPYFDLVIYALARFIHYFPEAAKVLVVLWHMLLFLTNRTDRSVALLPSL